MVNYIPCHCCSCFTFARDIHIVFYFLLKTLVYCTLCCVCTCVCNVRHQVCFSHWSRVADHSRLILRKTDHDILSWISIVVQDNEASLSCFVEEMKSLSTALSSTHSSPWSSVLQRDEWYFQTEVSMLEIQGGRDELAPWRSTGSQWNVHERSIATDFRTAITFC